MVRIRRPASEAANTIPEPVVPGPRQRAEPGTVPSSQPVPPSKPETPSEPVVPSKPPSEPVPPQGRRSARHVLERTRLGGTWVAVGCFAIVLLLLLIFIVENGNSVGVSYFGAHGHLPLGAALVLAAVCGARARRYRRAERKAASS